MKDVTVTPRELESVTAQIRILGALLRCRGTPGDAERAQQLETLINILPSPNRAAAAPATSRSVAAPAAAKSRSKKAAAGTPKAGAGKKKEN